MKKQRSEIHSTIRIIRFPELYRKIGLSRVQIWRLEKQDAFPQAVPLGKNSKGWIELEVDEWLIKRRNGGI